MQQPTHDQALLMPLTFFSSFWANRHFDLLSAAAAAFSALRAFFLAFRSASVSSSSS
jgi:hypothetical protein